MTSFLEDYLREYLKFNDIDLYNYKNSDNDPRGPWASSDFTAQGWRPNQMYTIITPSGKVVTPPEGRCWRQLESVYKQLLEDNRFWFGADGAGVPRKKHFFPSRRELLLGLGGQIKKLVIIRKQKKKLLLYSAHKMCLTPQNRNA